MQEEEAGLVVNMGKGYAGSGRILGCPSVGYETFMASKVEDTAPLHHEENVLVGYSRGDVSVDG